MNVDKHGTKINAVGAKTLIAFQSNQDPTEENVKMLLEGFTKEELLWAYTTMLGAFEVIVPQFSIFIHMEGADDMVNTVLDLLIRTGLDDEGK